jgi:hypothetical protein
MKETKTLFQHLNNNCIEADWTLSFHSANYVIIASEIVPALTDDNQLVQKFDNHLRSINVGYGSAQSELYIHATV